MSLLPLLIFCHLCISLAASSSTLISSKREAGSLVPHLYLRPPAPGFSAPLREKKNAEASVGVISAWELVLIPSLPRKRLCSARPANSSGFFFLLNLSKKNFSFHSVLSVRVTMLTKWPDLLACDHCLLWLNLQQKYKMEAFRNLLLESSAFDSKMGRDRTIYLECDTEKSGRC